MLPTLTSAIHEKRLPNETMTQYLHRTKAEDETITERARETLEDVLPWPPESLAAPFFTNIASDSCDVMWNEPEGGGQPTEYVLNVDVAGTPITGSPFTVNHPITTLKLSGLTASTKYTVQLIAQNSYGSEIAPLATFTTMTTAKSATPDTTWKKDELIAYANENNIAVDPNSKKSDILEAING